MAKVARKRRSINFWTPTVIESAFDVTDSNLRKFGRQFFGKFLAALDLPIPNPRHWTSPLHCSLEGKPASSTLSSLLPSCECLSTCLDETKEDRTQHLLPTIEDYVEVVPPVLCTVLPCFLFRC